VSEVSSAPAAAFDMLTRLGVYIHRNFLPIDLCSALSVEMTTDAGTDGIVIRDGASIVDLEQKRLKAIVLDAGRHADLGARFDALASPVADFFDTPVTGHEGAYFYRYDAGDYYRTHRDRYGAAAGTIGHERQISVVLFLNGPSGHGGPEYGGGDLVLYDLLGNDRLVDYGLPVPAEAGLLVAFRPDLRHEVTTVARGVRCVAVTRFF
jgi:predicted 2-oxoglutarate/Fe(II)-dependent dioxygenase YbiX